MAVTVHALVMTTTANRLLSKTLLRLRTNTFRFSSSYGKTRGNSFASSTIPKNMVLRHCSPIPTITTTATTMQDTIAIQADQQQTITLSARPLVIIMAWMLAKDKHLEKYRQMWFKRGCDVLTVRTSPIDLLLPPVGGKVVANNLVNYLLEMNPQYRQILIHAFSVGGYQFGEFLSKLRTSDEYNIISDSVRGVICDSIVYTEDAAPGLSRAITKNPVLQPLLEGSIYGFLKLFHGIAVKNYERASNEFFNLYQLRCPGLVFYSEDDIVSNVNTNKRLISSWNKRGLSVQSKCWQTSTHVLHYHEHTSEYEQQIDMFLKKLNLRNS